MDAILATYAVGAAATFVGLVQARIYHLQRRTQENANKQALFDRRMRLFLNVQRFAEHYVAVEGMVGSSQSRTEYEDAIVHAPFLFTKKVRQAFANVDRRLKEHAAAMPPVEYDVYGDMQKPTAPLPVAEIVRLRRAIKDLAEEVESDLRLAD